jgi:hypothetical protein
MVDRYLAFVRGLLLYLDGLPANHASPQAEGHEFYPSPVSRASVER